MSNTMPTGYNVSNSVWVAPLNVYPYFGWQGPLVTVSGTAYNGSSVIPSALVGLVSGGVQLSGATTNSSGFYSILQPSNMVSGGALTFLKSNGVANTFSDGTNGYSGMDLYLGTVSALNAASGTQSALSVAMSATLGSNAGSNFLFTVPNGQVSVNSGANLWITSSAPAFNIDQPLSAPGNLLVNSSGNLSVAGGQQLAAGAGNSITLNTGGVFTNNAGPNLMNVSGGGRWLVYSQNPANDNRGGLAYDFKQYNATYGVTAPAQNTGNGFLYTLAPSITVALTGSVSKTYDGTTTTSLPGGSLIASGTVDGDNVTVEATGAAYNDKNAGTQKGVTASGLSIASASNGGVNVYGYQLSSSFASGNIGEIVPAVLAYSPASATRSFGEVNPLLTGTVVGLVPGDTLASVANGQAVFTTNANVQSLAGLYSITGSGLTLTTGNYTLGQVPGAATAFSITPLSIALGNVPWQLGNTDPSLQVSYSGPESTYLAALLQSLPLVTSTPFSYAPGTYPDTALIPANLAGSIIVVPGTLVVSKPTAPTLIEEPLIPLPLIPQTMEAETLDAIPAFLNVSPLLPMAPLSPPSVGATELLPGNALGMFQIAIAPSPDWSPGRGSTNLASSSFTEISPDGRSKDKKSTYAAGAKQ